LHEHLVEQEGRPGLLDTVPQEKFSVSRYRKLKGIINPYAWGLYVDNSLTEANIGISSRDILSTTSINLGYLYDISERTSAWRAAVSYQGIYPIIDLQASLSNRSVSEGATQFYDTITDPVSVVTRDLRFKWREKNIQAGIKIPFMTTSSRFSGNVTIGNYFGVSTIEEFKNNIDEGGRIVRITDSTAYFFRDYADNGTLAYNYFSFNAYRLLKRSRRDINSKWGQSVTMDFFNTPYGGDFTGRLFAFTGLAYFPGLFKHHSLWGYWAYQGTQFENSRENYVFRNQVPVPRGHSISRFQHFYSMSVNYALPLWYPDVSIGPLINFQRVRANVFFDYGSGASKLFGVARDYISTGAELKLDLNIFRFLPQLDIGVRFSKGITPSTTEFEVLLGTFNF
jgi:hypothetical protein